MELHQIETHLKSPDPQKRMKGITELRHHEPSLVVPLLGVATANGQKTTLDV